MASSFRFDRFTLDPGDRRLEKDGEPVEINARYLDALALLVSEEGRLVSKDRFLDEVWRGIPVTDEALTQCIKTLRRQLGDDASNPRLIETVPKHGYRFVAPVERLGTPTGSPVRFTGTWREFLLLGLAGTMGGAVAGIFGGLFYGFAATSPGVGAASVLLVLLALTLLVALLGGAGVAFGIAASAFAPDNRGPIGIAGGALGGLIVGAAVKLLGLDAFNLLFGRAPGEITGPFEGALIGGAVGFGGWIAGRAPSVRRGAAVAALCGGGAGILIPLLGGRLMGGSLALLVDSFPGSRLRLDRIGRLFGEQDFGLASQTAMGGIEGALFAGCVVAGMLLARRALTDPDRPPAS